jgi:hypothetical protein
MARGVSFVIPRWFAGSCACMAATARTNWQGSLVLYVLRDGSLATSCCC